MARHPIIEPMDGPTVIGNAQKRRRSISAALASAPTSLRVVVEDEQKRSRHVIFEPLDGPVVIGGGTLPKKGRIARITLKGRLLPMDDD